ncbi:hypothetical protein B0H67DRAFT_446972, partial [Lasiosphaeris hirsuta]
LMASTASALTLSNFQVITSSGVPIACILAYNNQIPSCTTADFTLGNACSAACVKGLEKVADTLDDVCNGAQVSSASLLGQVLLGNLVDLLCPSAGTTTSSSSKTSTASRTTTTSSTTLSKTTLTPVSSRTATSTPQPTTTQTDAPESSSTEAAPTTLIPSFVQSDAGASPTVPTQTTGAQATLSPAEPTPEAPLGGGSPFDFVATGGSRPLVVGWLQSLLFALGVGLILL